MAGSGGSGGGGGRGVVPSTECIMIDGDVRGSNRSLLDIMADLKVADPPGAEIGAGLEEEDDLLGLMDAAGE